MEFFAKRGDAIYERAIRPHLGPKDRGKFLAIDIETGEYELARSEMKAGDRLLARIPDAQIWMMRVGFRAIRRFGGRDERAMA
jgi:hypothetical protein